MAADTSHNLTRVETLTHPTTMIVVLEVVGTSMADRIITITTAITITNLVCTRAARLIALSETKWKVHRLFRRIHIVIVTTIIITIIIVITMDRNMGFAGEAV